MGSFLLRVWPEVSGIFFCFDVWPEVSGIFFCFDVWPEVSGILFWLKFGQKLVGSFLAPWRHGPMAPWGHGAFEIQTFLLDKSVLSNRKV